MMLVGGKALGRTSGDTDFWVKEGVKVELYSKQDYSFMPKEVMEAFSPTSKDKGVACLEDLLAIKMSHLPWDIFWWKHAQDVLYMQAKGVRVNQKLYDVLVAYWERKHSGNTILSLYKTKDQFFSDAVVKHFEHDELHRLIARDGLPVYTRCLKDGQEVLVDWNKFTQLPFADKVRMFQEEIAVIALERWVIPTTIREVVQGGSVRKYTLAEAWNKALHKTVVDLTKGKASRFIIENLTEFTKPLAKEMLNVLELLKLKENYMSDKITLKQLEEMIKSELTLADISEWNISYIRKNNPDITDEEVLERYADDLDQYELFVEGRWVVDQDGGGEGGSEYCESVIALGDKFYKVVYCYYSHHGFDFDDAEVRVVSPVEKTITVYE